MNLYWVPFTPANKHWYTWHEILSSIFFMIRIFKFRSLKCERNEQKNAFNINLIFYNILAIRGRQFVWIWNTLIENSQKSQMNFNFVGAGMFSTSSTIASKGSLMSASFRYSIFSSFSVRPKENIQMIPSTWYQQNLSVSVIILLQT